MLILAWYVLCWRPFPIKDARLIKYLGSILSIIIHSLVITELILGLFFIFDKLAFFGGNPVPTYNRIPRWGCPRRRLCCLWRRRKAWTRSCTSWSSTPGEHGLNQIIWFSDWKSKTTEVKVRSFWFPKRKHLIYKICSYLVPHLDFKRTIYVVKHTWNYFSDASC